jgi:hypothetical protein
MGFPRVFPSAYLHIRHQIQRADVERVSILPLYMEYVGCKVVSMPPSGQHMIWNSTSSSLASEQHEDLLNLLQKSHHYPSLTDNFLKIHS